MPLNAKAPARVKVVGTPAVAQALAVPPGLWHAGVFSGTPAPGTKLFRASPQPAKTSPRPAVTFVNVPDWLAERVNGLPAGKAKLFSANSTVKLATPAEIF